MGQGKSTCSRPTSSDLALIAGTEVTRDDPVAGCTKRAALSSVTASM